MKTTAWLSKHLAIISQFWLVKSSNWFKLHYIDWLSHTLCLPLATKDSLHFHFPILFICNVWSKTIVLLLHSTIHITYYIVLYVCTSAQGACTHLAFEFPIQQDVPCSQVPVDKLLVWEVLHTISNLSAELKQLMRQLCTLCAFEEWWR